MRRTEREINDLSLIEDIIRNSDVCRIAMANGDLPYVVTMNFGYSIEPDLCLYFHCANEGKKLNMIQKNNYVCFTMDTDHQLYTGENACDCGMRYSSITGYGHLKVLKDYESKLLGLNYIMSHYCNKQVYSFKEKIVKDTTILKLDITEISGKKC